MREVNKTICRTKNCKLNHIRVCNAIECDSLNIQPHLHHQQSIPSWEEEFNNTDLTRKSYIGGENITSYTYFELDPEKIKSFISSLLEAQKKDLLEKIGGMKKNDNGGDTRFSKEACKWCGAKEVEYHKSPCKTLEKIIYNQALEDIKSLIKE